MADFDPKAYIQKAKQEHEANFSPNAYIEMAKASQSAPNSTSALQAFGEHAANAATFGYLPHLQALASKFAPNPNAGLDEKMKAEGFNIVQAEPNYVEERDANIKRLATESKEHPWASGFGTAAGIIAGGAMGGGLLGGGKAAATAGHRLALSLGGKKTAAKLIGKAFQGAEAGAKAGFLANPGDVEGQIDPLQLGARAQNAPIAAVIGASVPIGVEGVKRGGKGIAEYLKEKAAEKAFRSLGRGTPTQMQKAVESGKNIEIGQALLDEGAIPIFGTPKRIAHRVEALKEKAGEKVGQIIDSVDDQGVPYTPIKIKNPKRGTVVQEEVEVTPIRFEENPVRRTMPWLSEKDAPARIIRGETQPIQKVLIEPPKHQVIAGKVKTVPVRGTTVDTQKIAKSILNSKEVEALRKTPGMEAAVAAIEKQVETLAKNGELNLRAVQALRQGIDRSIKWNKLNPGTTGSQEGLYMQRSALANAMNDVVNRRSPGAATDALKKANRAYGNLAEAEAILEKELARNQSNRAISLTDTVMAAGGAATGKPGLAFLLGGLNKAGRTFGNSMMARGASAGSRLAEKSAGLSEQLAGIAPYVASGGASYRSGEFTHAEPVDPEILLLLKQNPELIDQLKNDDFKAQVNKALGRTPTGKLKEKSH